MSLTLIHLSQEAIVLSTPDARVLCVDDDEDSRLMLVTLLRLESIEAKAVGTAAQALSLIEAEHFDLCMLDVRLPDVDGLELCRRMRAVPRTLRFSSFPALKLTGRKGLKRAPMLMSLSPTFMICWKTLSNSRRMV
jgi:CheY-like chemotaxis protein